MKHLRTDMLRSAAGIHLERKDAEPTLAEIKKMVTDLMTNFEETKSAQDTKLADIEKKGVTDVLVDEKIKRLDEDFAKKHGQLQAALQEVEKKANRPGLGDNYNKDAALELKHFNAALKGHAQVNSKALPADVGAEEYKAYQGAMLTYMVYGKDGMSDVEKKAAQIGSDPSGGYLVTPEIDNNITRVVTQIGAMRSLATVRSIGSASLKKIVQTSGASFGGWGNEKTPATETGTPDLAKLEFAPGTCWAAPRATTELLEDASIDIASWLVGEVDLVFDEQESSGFVSGDGKNNKPNGVLSYPTIQNGAYSWGSVGYVRSGDANAFAGANPSDRLMDLMHAVRRQYRSGSSFIMTDKTLATIRKFKDGQGNYLWVPGLQGGVVGVLLGKPVVTDDFWDELGANKFPIGYGDWKRGYIIVDRRGTTVLRDPYTAQPYVKFVVTRRVGGGVQNFEAFKLMKCEAGAAYD